MARRDLRVLIAGGRRLHSEALRTSLRGLGIDAVLPSEGRDVLEAVEAHRPDLVLLDLRHPREPAPPGQAIADRFPGVKVVAVLSSLEPGLVREARRRGLKNLVTGHTSARGLAHVLRSVAEGHVVVPEGSEDERTEAVSLDGLTPREHEVLELLVEGAGNEEIALRMAISQSTVRTHVHSVLTKLHARSRLEAATQAVRRGLVRVGHGGAHGWGPVRAGRTGERV